MKTTKEHAAESDDAQTSRIERDVRMMLGPLKKGQYTTWDTLGQDQPDPNTPNVYEQISQNFDHTLPDFGTCLKDKGYLSVRVTEAIIAGIALAPSNPGIRIVFALVNSANVNPPGPAIVTLETQQSIDQIAELRDTLGISLTIEGQLASQPTADHGRSVWVIEGTILQAG